MKRQQGVALITVLLVVAVVTIVCAGMIARQQVSIRSSANLLDTRRAWQYALGGETLAKAMLKRDARAGAPGQTGDHLGEPWARPMPPFALDESGVLNVRIEDLSGRFNLNSLVHREQVDALAVRRFQRLLLRLGIVAPYAERLVDWLDQNQEPTGSEGAEDNQYLLAKPAYRPANRRLQDVSELRLLLGMTEVDYRRLQPYVSALPSDAALNVNTAGAMVLSSLADGLAPAVAQGVVQARGATGFASVEAFLNQPGLAGLGIDGQGLAVATQYFQVISEVRMGDRRQVVVSSVHRDEQGRVRVLARDLGQDGLVQVQQPQNEQQASVVNEEQAP
ncbi:type II secretion system minor pseudopilin GspK [Pseudomonas turukhanskensis]|uniref:Type II secretion system protein K n=1 Tax=Pseudomonas turukhanskensis TaxID=1806536 RepID=A0A9W6K547_9PSED|nr:type II secretion system minor pseudopilin GspK [Pseudomonas turukhanskensis]GLK88431.1 type II secretion system protein K [Pseudomonas turukhanskensis]